MKILLIIGVILSMNMALAEDILTKNTTPPITAALIIFKNVISSIEKSGKNNIITPESIKTLIKTNFLPNIAVKVVTKLILKKHWHSLDDQQKKIFQQYVIESLIDDYSNAFSAYKKDNIHVSANPKVKRKDNRAIVKLIFKFDNKSEPVHISVKMINLQQWRIYDVVFSGVSLIKNYQAQFNSYIKRKGIDGLVNKLIHKSTKN